MSCVDILTVVGYKYIIVEINNIFQTKNTNLSKKEVLDNIMLNKEINKIIWDKNHDNPQMVKLQCSDGSTYLVDHVILTVSVAVLNDIHKSVFEPSLPSYKVNCIEHIPLGTAHKIFLKFSKTWWPTDVKDFSFLWTDEDKKGILTEFPVGPVCNGR